MAEFVEIELERSVLELEKLIAIGLFDQSEVRKIAQQRRDNAYSLQKRTKDKADFVKFIRFEEDLLNKIRLKRKYTGNKERWVETDLQMKERLQRFHRAAVERYQADIDMWMSYFRFCARHKFYKFGNKMLQRLVQVHGEKQHLWNYASQWSLKKKNKDKPNWEAGRMWLVTGLQRHPDSKELYLALIKFDLELAQQASEGTEEDDPERAKTSLACAKVSYRNAVKNIQDAEFVADLMTLINDYTCADELKAIVVSDLEENFSQSEESWHGRAMNALKNAPPPEIANLDADLVLQFRIEKCVEIFREAVEKLPTAKMWRKYIDYVKVAAKQYQLMAVPDLNAELYKRAIPGAIEKEFASEDDFADLADYQLSTNKKEKSVETLENGLKRYPESCLLWYELIRAHLSVDDVEAAENDFNLAITQLKKLPARESVKIWTMVIGYFLEEETQPDKLEKLFQQGLKYSVDLAQTLKPQYLEWRYLVHGLEKARELLSNAYVTNPPCLEFYKKLLELECSEANPDIRLIRRDFESTLQLFGTNEPDLWMDYLNFEREKGDAKQVVKIYERGVRGLKKDKVDDLITKYALNF